MNKSLLPLATFLISVFALAANAQEIVTLSKSKPSVTLTPTDLVRIIGGNQTRNSGYAVGYMTLAGQPEQYMNINGIVGNVAVPFDTLSGLTSIRLGKSGVNGNPSQDPPEEGAFLVLQITKAGQHLFSEPLVTPGVADAKYDVILETSTDMTNWSPTVPGEFLGNSGQRFFRVRAVVKTVPVP